MPSKSARRYVIVIDDHALVRESERQLLEVAGYAVAEVADPADLSGLDLDAGTDVAILADFELAGTMTGVDIALAIMSITGRKIPTLVLSGSVGDNASMSASAHHLPFLTKPVTDTALLEWLEGAFANAKPEHPDVPARR